MEEQSSPAYQLVSLIWDHGQEGTGHSWTRLNTALYQAVKLAIEAGLVFHPGDITRIRENMRGGYWFHVPSCEHWYARAIEFDNRSAWKAIEQHLARKPFILQGKRLHVESLFWYKGAPVRVTSFAPNQSYLVACSTWGAGKVRRIWKITHSLLKGASLERQAEVPCARQSESGDGPGGERGG